MTPKEWPPATASVHLPRAGPAISFVALALVIGCLAVRDAAVQRERAIATMRDLRTSFSARRLLEGRDRFLGNRHARFTLVEFGDYQCPPCRANRPSVKAAVEQFAPGLRVDFRNYPLTGLHPRAMEAASIAETVTDPARFWRLHNRLMTSDLAVPGTARRLAAELGLASYPKRGDARVARDLRMGDVVGVRSTPTFLLCSPTGEVYRLRSLADLSLFLRWPGAGAL